MSRLMILLSILFAMAGCRHQHAHEHQHGAQNDHTDHNEPGHHHNANEYMHQSTIEELIERFDAPERDAYQQPEKVLEYLGDLNNMKVMDIGAGSGYFTFRLARTGANVIAADVEDGFLEHIQNRLKMEGSGSGTVELRKLPYDDPLLSEAEVDMVLVVNTYHHIENRAAYFSKVHNGIQTDGELVIIDFFKKEIPVGPPPSHKISSEQVMKELEEAGFTEFDLNDTLLDYQFILRCR